MVTLFLLKKERRQRKFIKKASPKTFLPFLFLLGKEKKGDKEKF